MTDEQSAFDASRVPPYTRVSAADLAAAVAERKAHVASVAPARDVPRSVQTRKGETWQQRVLRYDDEGPGFVGWVLDAKSFLASIIPTIVQERTPEGQWVTSTDPMANVAMTLLRNDQQDLSGLLAGWYRMMESVGELWVTITDSEMGGIAVDLVSINQLQWVKGPTGKEAAVLTYPEQSPKASDVQRVPEDQVMRSWHKRSDWPALPTSQWKRAIPDVERYIATRRNITRVLNSRLVTNGLLHFHVGAGQPVNPATPGAPTPVPKVISDYAAMTSRAIRNDDDEAAYAPFPLWGGDGPPTWVEVGRMLDPTALEAEVAALKAVGRSINFPLQLLVEGPGAGNHWSDVFLNEQFLSQDVAGTLQLVLHDATLGPYRRILTALLAGSASDLDPRRYRLWYDLSELGKRLDDVAEVLDLVLAGLLSPDAARARLRISKDEAPKPGDLPPPVQQLPRSTSNLLPGAPARAAAVQSVPRADIRTVAADLNKLDANLFLTLDGLSQRTVRAITIAVGQRLLDALPPADPERLALSALPAERVWAAAPPELRALVDTEAVVRQFVAPAEQEAEDHLLGVLISIGAVYAAAGLLAPQGIERNVTAFREQFTAGITDTASQHIDVEPIPMAQAGTVPQRWSPTAVARTAMNAAAGAIETPDPDGRPQLPDGTWEGGSGPATGPDSMAALRLEFGDLQVSYRWDHGTPPNPFIPHQQLNGKTYTNEDRIDVLANLDDNGVPQTWPSVIYHPGDHAGCTCNEEIILTTTLS